MKIYKIRDNSTGRFSRGGHDPSWSKDGKTWTSIHHLKNHLRVARFNYPTRPVEIVTYEVTEVESVPVKIMLDEIIKSEEEKERKEKERQEKYWRDQEIKKLKELQNKYPDVK